MSGEKPEVELIGADGNAFVIMGKVRYALKKAGQADKVEEFTTEATSGDYDNLLRVVGEYVTIV